MKSFETVATVESGGQLRLAGIPFQPGTEVEVTVLPKRASSDDFRSEWTRLTAEMRSNIGAVSDETIQQEITAYRDRK